MSNKAIMIRQYESLKDSLLNQINFIQSLAEQSNTLTEIAEKLGDSQVEQQTKESLNKQIDDMNNTIKLLVQNIKDMFIQYQNYLDQIFN